MTDAALAPAPDAAQAPAPAPAAGAAAADAAPAPAEAFTHTADPGPLAAEIETPAVTAAPEPAPTEPAATEPAATAPPVTEAPAVTAAPIEYKFEFPEGFTADKEGIDGATEIFRKHNIAPETAQELMNTATSAIGRALAAVPEQQQRAFSDMKKGWLEQSMADAVIGGPAWKTSVAAANDVLANTALIPKSERRAFNQFLVDTGASHHPQMMKLLNRMNSFLREPAAPLPAINPPKGGNQAGGRKGAILTHPTSKAS